MNILKSASKIVLLIFGLTSSAAFLSAVLYNVTNENIVLAVITLYSSAVSSVMTYYFTKRSEKKDGNPI